MKRHINSPYKMNWKMYGLIGGISVLIMIIALILFVEFNRLVPRIIVVIIITIPTILQFIVGTI